MDKRVRSIFKTHPPNQHGERHEEMIQVLEVSKPQKFFWWSWNTWIEIDREIVPSGIWQQAFTLGSTDWKSKWNGMPDIHWVKY
tara:strand:- start:8168 stop:8419 length:252 start_codon:yes stop_codon:yes gene_type:complete